MLFIRLITVCALLVFSQVAPSQVAKKPASAKEVVVVMKNELVKDHKVWVPSRSEVPVGSMVKIELENQLADPHGFEIVGYAKPIVVMPNTKAIVSFKADKVGPVIFKCHMHPAHVGGTLQVK